jgi:lipopolysaccharide transport system ATP-binding protein
MYVRLAFSVAAHLEPEILVVDEVLAVGDTGFQRKCMGKMSEVSHAGRTVLLVSHNMAAIENLCGRVIVIEKGRILFDGNPEEAILKYTQLMGSATQKPLGDRTERTGSGQVKITSFQIVNEDGMPVKELLTGGSYTFEFGFKAKIDNVRDLDFAFAVRDTMNRVLFRNSTVEAGIQIPETLPQSGVLKCDIPKLPLTKGKYFFGFRLVVNGVESDYIRGGYAAEFSVENGDFYQTGKISNFAPMLIRHNWSIEEAEDQDLDFNAHHGFLR